MQETALARGHGSEGEWLAGVTHLLDRDFGGQLQLALTEDFEVVGVEGDVVMLLVLETEDLGGDVLKGKEEFAVTGEEEGGVRAAELHADLGGMGGGVARLRLAVAGKDAVLQLQTADVDDGLKEVSDFF